MRILMIFLVVGFLNCKSNSQQLNPDHSNATLEANDTKEANDNISFINSSGKTINIIEKSTDEWHKVLTEMEFYVLRDKGTERSNTGDLLKNKKEGVYTCAACNLELFASNTKYKSGSGWPSFYEPVDKKHVLEDTDHDLGYARTEVMCKRCGGHLGHVFSDGPEPTGLRYCINSASLNFEEKNP